MAAALGAVLVGLRNLNLGAGLWIAGSTVLVTLVIVFVRRRFLPQALSLTVSRDAVTFRRFGRSKTISLGPGTP